MALREHVIVKDVDLRIVNPQMAEEIELIIEKYCYENKIMSGQIQQYDVRLTLEAKILVKD